MPKRKTKSANNQLKDLLRRVDALEKTTSELKEYLETAHPDIIQWRREK